MIFSSSKNYFAFSKCRNNHDAVHYASGSASQEITPEFIFISGRAQQKTRLASFLLLAARRRNVLPGLYHVLLHLFKHLRLEPRRRS